MSNLSKREDRLAQDLARLLTGPISASKARELAEKVITSGGKRGVFGVAI